MMGFSREELTFLMQEYEASHHVDTYIVNGWHVWPMLRLILCMGWLPVTTTTHNATQKKLTSKTLIYARKMAGRAYRWLICQRYSYNLRHSIKLHDKYDPERNDRYDIHRDVVLLTLSERRVMLNGSLFEIYSDPLVEILKDMGVSTLVWEYGEPRYPRHSRSAWISSRLEAACKRLKSPAMEDVPGWFADYQALSQKIIGRVVAWPEIKGQLDGVTQQSLVFERWLRKIKPGLLIAVCWYAPLVMAATMAARRLGIATVELQHGVQDKGHFAYSAWNCSPQNGYEVVPNFFWNWGTNSANDLKRNNPAFAVNSTFLAGGNLWLNRWLSHHSSSCEQNPPVPIGSEDKTILVSLQLDIEEILIDAIRESPRSWKWLLRFHPARDQVKREQEKQLLKELNHPGIELEKANKLLLYELLKKTDVHITGYSTCALEAIAMGVPSITIGSSGRSAFKQMIDDGSIYSAETSEELLVYIRTGTVSAAASEAIQKEFSGNDKARNTLSYLLERERPTS